MLVDSHCHLDKLDYQGKHQNIKDVLDKAAKRGVSHMLSVGVTLEAFPAMLEMISPYDHVFASCGVHPLDQDNETNEQKLLEYGQLDKVVAIGETGLDYFYSPDNKEQQQRSFRQHVRAAKVLGKPLIIHTRDARQDTLDILKEEGAEQVGGVLHCFTESLEMAQAAMEMGFYISISGIVTFNNAAELREVVKQVPLDRLLVETDSPYLAPVPYRGEQNEPAYVRAVAEFVADLKGVSYQELAKQSSNNFFELFKFAKE